MKMITEILLTDRKFPLIIAESKESVVKIRGTC